MTAPMVATDWRVRLNADPLPWLLDAGQPAVRHRALRDLLDRSADDAEAVAVRAAAMEADPHRRHSGGPGPEAGGSSRVAAT